MKCLKKPVAIKKIRKYKDDVRNTNFGIANKHSFISKSGIMKSTYLENMLDLGSPVSALSLKGGYFYKKYSSDEYFLYQNKNIIDLGVSDEKQNLSLLTKPNRLLFACLYSKFLFSLLVNKCR